MRKRRPKNPKRKRGRPSTGFDRVEYQRLYMADVPKARLEGLTVAKWRAAKGVKS